jgi:hypothetical protein
MTYFKILSQYKGTEKTFKTCYNFQLPAPYAETKEDRNKRREGRKVRRRRNGKMKISRPMWLAKAGVH